MVTGGQGHANAVAALPTALAGESPVLLLSGHAPLAELGNGAFQELPQAVMAAPVTKASWTAQTAGGLAGDIARAVSTALSGRPGPVHLSLPTDLLEAETGEVPLPEASSFARVAISSARSVSSRRISSPRFGAVRSATTAPAASPIRRSKKNAPQWRSSRCFRPRRTAAVSTISPAAGTAAPAAPMATSRRFHTSLSAGRMSLRQVRFAHFATSRVVRAN